MRRLLSIALAATLAATLLFVPGASAAETATGSGADAVEIDEPRPERPKLRCRGHIDAMNGKPRVTCTWRETTHPDAAGYKLIRRGGGERVVVHRTDDLAATRHTDKDVEFDTRYRYRLVVVDADGERLQRSRWNRAAVARPDVERLALDCGVVDRTDAVPETDAAERAPHVVACAWRPTTSPAAVEYQLWRKVKGQHRELVATVDLDTLAARDEVPADTAKVIYAVLALDHNGEIVRRSGVARIRFPAVGAH